MSLGEHPQHADFSEFVQRCDLETEPNDLSDTELIEATIGTHRLLGVLEAFQVDLDSRDLVESRSAIRQRSIDLEEELGARLGIGDGSGGDSV